MLNVKIRSLKCSVKTAEKILHMYKNCRPTRPTDKTCLSPKTYELL